MKQFMKNRKLIAMVLLIAMLCSIMPTAVFAASDSVPFTVTADGTEISVELSEETYTHINWDSTTGSTVQLYIAFVPTDVEVVTLDFGNDKVLVYGYAEDGTYIDAYDEYEDIMVGSSSASVTVKNFGYYAEVQTPYDENWANELLYAVAFEYEAISTPEIIVGEVSIDKLLENISNQYTADASEWVIFDMAAYESVTASVYQTSDKAKQAYINSAITSINKTSVSETTYSKAILALTSIGINAQELYPENSTMPIKALDALMSLPKDMKANITPYTLMSYNQGYGSGTDEIDLVKALIGLQCDDGGWVHNGSGNSNGSVDETGNVLAALAFYRNNDAVKNDVNKAIDDAVKFLKSNVSIEGTYAGNSNSTAMAVIGLASIYDTNDSEIKELFNQSVEGLLTFALVDNSGFGVSNNTVKNALATEQGFRALIAASQVMQTGEAFNVYDFSGNSLEPGYEKEINNSGSNGSGSYVPKDDKITVKVSIKSNSGYWLQNKSVTVEENATVCDALLKAIKGTGIEQEGAENGYIESMTYNDTELAEFTMGDNSGWLYKINGEKANVGVLDYYLSDGDKVLFYYTEDWTKESLEDDESKEEEKDKQDENKQQTTPINTVFADVDAHWANVSIQFVYDTGLLRGVSATEFAPDATFSRAMIAAVLHRLAGNPEFGWSYPFKDVSDIAWYAGPITWAYQNHLVGGMTEDTYAPELPVTREQLAVMLMRYAAYRGYDTTASNVLNHYTDVDTISDYALPAMQWATSIGLINGRTADTLVPQGTATRAEVAVMLERFIKLYQLEKAEVAAK